MDFPVFFFPKKVRLRFHLCSMSFGGQESYGVTREEKFL
jgi:hypothetical protein